MEINKFWEQLLDSQVLLCSIQVCVPQTKDRICNVFKIAHLSFLQVVGIGDKNHILFRELHCFALISDLNDTFVYESGFWRLSTCPPRNEWNFWKSSFVASCSLWKIICSQSISGLAQEIIKRFCYARSVCSGIQIKVFWGSCKFSILYFLIPVQDGFSRSGSLIGNE